MAKLNDAFGKEFKNDDAIKNLAVKHIEAMASKETLSMDELWAEEKMTEKTQNCGNDLLRREPEQRQSVCEVLL